MTVPGHSSKANFDKYTVGKLQQICIKFKKLPAPQRLNELLLTTESCTNSGSTVNSRANKKDLPFPSTTA